MNTAGGSISKLVASFPGLYIEEFDGTDVLSSWEACGRAVAYARQRKGPAFLHAHVVRPYSHSMSDDERLYRTEPERDLETGRDPIVKLRAYLIEHGHATASELQTIEQEIEQQIKDASDRALQQHP